MLREQFAQRLKTVLNRLCNSGGYVREYAVNSLRLNQEAKGFFSLRRIKDRKTNRRHQSRHNKE